MTALLLGTTALTLSTPAYGQATANPPERMTYQGFLVGSDGVALGNSAPKNYDVIFRIYDHESASAPANLLWAEQQTVTVDKGYFNVLLGEGASTGEPRPDLSTLFRGATASDRYVGITVKGIGSGGANVDILPRLRLMASPYAFLAMHANKLVRSDNNADLLTSSQNVLTLNGQMRLLGPNSLEFGAGLTKEANNGRIGYQLFSTGLDIVGAGADVANRRITFHAQGGSSFNGPVTASSFTGTHFGDGSGLSGVAKLGANTFTGYQEVQNHLRIGEINTTVGSPGWGEALIFSGAPPLTAGFNSDNSDPLWMARFNTAANSSELRMVIGDDPGSTTDRFVIGTMLGDGNFNQAASWSPLYAFRANGMLEFRPGINKEVSAGTIGYQVHSADSLDIVGAGTTGSNRKVQMWAEGGFQVNGSMNVAGNMNVAGVFNVNTFNGPTFQVLSDVMRVYNGNNKGQFFQMFRYPQGVALQGFGGGWGNASGDFRQITWDGDGNWDAASDRKLKKDIVDAEPVLERALQVQVRRFRWKDDPADAKMNFGVIAQELQPLFPDLIATQENPNTKETNLAVGYSDFGLIAVKALQEFKQKHDAEVADLKAQLAELKAQMAEVVRATSGQRDTVEKSKVTAAVDR